MAFTAIGVGSSANDGTGDPLRTAFQTINANFTALNNGTQPVLGSEVRTADQASQFGAKMSTRASGATSFEWGHPNTAGYGCSLGYNSGSGLGFIGFGVSAGTSSNTFKTYGLKGMVVQPTAAGDLSFAAITNASADNQVETVFFTLLNTQKVGVKTTAPEYDFDVNGTFGFTPGSSVTPSQNGDVVFELTSNTALTVKAKGSDAVVRSGTITLS